MKHNNSPNDNPKKPIKKVKFEDNIFQIGYGSVGQCILPLVLKHVDIDPKKITVMDAHNNKDIFDKNNYHCQYVRHRVTKSNMEKTLQKYLRKGDMLINVSTDIAGIEITKWCQVNGVLYIDTSIENWPTEFQTSATPALGRTLYNSHQAIRKKLKVGSPHTTAIVTHGANPGLVSHFTKAALLDIARHLKKNRETPETKEQWADLAANLKVKVIHISERDTQISSKPKEKDEFVNTWSVEGFWAEGIAPAEMGWGTHEKELPPSGGEHAEGPKNAIYINRPGCNTYVRSWVPLGGDIHGFCIQHSEAVTISDYLTQWKNGKAVYRPTVHYAYHPCDAAIVSMHELRMKQYAYPEVQRIMNDDIISGIDELGVLLMGHDANAWWYGSQLGIEETRQIMGKGHNPTTLQVAAALIGGIVWMIKNPEEGYLEPDDLPFAEILEIANLYLGPIASVQSDWNPLKERSDLFPTDMDKEDLWQFKNFLVKGA